MGEPARGYSWPQVRPGERLAEKHGVWRSDRAEQVAAEVDALAAQLARTYPWTAAYADERRAYARALLDEQCIRDYLDEVGMLDEDHTERPAVRTLARFSGIAATRRKELGITPQAHARLLLTVSEVVRAHPERGAGALDGPLEDLLAQGREAWALGAGGAEAEP